MPQGSDQEKTEQATPKRLEEMREKGQVAKSREVPSAAILIASLLHLLFPGVCHDQGHYGVDGVVIR